MLHQPVEHLLRWRIDESILGQLADHAGGIGRERVQEHLAHARVVLGLERQRAPFAIQDLVQLLANLFEGTAEVESLLFLPAHGVQPAAQGIEPGEPTLHPTTHEPTESALGVGAHQDVVRELLQYVGGIDLRPEGILGAIPA